MSLVKPATQRECNTRPCVVVSYDVGDWTACPDGCGGEQTRSIRCIEISSIGVSEIPLSQCEATSALVRPREVRACPACSHCEQSLPVYCSGHGECSTSSECQCEPGFYGEFCSQSTSCPGVLDIQGQCCEGLLLSNGSCCSGEIDASGSCCEPPARIDACGVCGGNASFVDAQGVCCAGVPDAGGVCCTSWLDSLGVCGGEDRGTQLAQLSVDNRAGLTASDIAQGDGSPGVRNVKNAIQEHTATSIGRSVASVEVVDLALILRALRALNLRSRSLQTGQLDADVELSPDGPGKSLIERNILQEQLTQPPTGAAAALIAVQGISASRMVPTCGNTLCEAGERPNPQAGIDGCATDCPFPVLACPAGSDGKECSGLGACINGECDCFERMGYTGVACEQCADGFARVNGTCVRAVLSFSCVDGIQNGDEEGVDCGGSCPDACGASGVSYISSSRLAVALAVGLGVLVVAILFALRQWKHSPKENSKENRKPYTFRGDFVQV